MTPSPAWLLEGHDSLVKGGPQTQKKVQLTRTRDDRRRVTPEIRTKTRPGSLAPRASRGRSQDRMTAVTRPPAAGPSSPSQPGSGEGPGWASAGASPSGGRVLPGAWVLGSRGTRPRPAPPGAPLYARPGGGGRGAPSGASSARAPALFGRRNEGGSVVRCEEDEGVSRDLQVPEEAQNPPDAVVDLADGVPIPAGEPARAAGAGGVRDRTAAGP